MSRIWSNVRLTPEVGDLSHRYSARSTGILHWGLSEELQTTHVKGAQTRSAHLCKHIMSVYEALRIRWQFSAEISPSHEKLLAGLFAVGANRPVGVVY